ncbi:MAG: HAD-IA family hydrolase [Gammaproteobacteria bacterium]
MRKIETVLFDLDGTLLDTAPDLTFALNKVRQQHQLPALPVSAVRPHIGYGAKAILKAGLNMEDTHPDYPACLENFLAFYQTCSSQLTQPFPEIEKVLSYLEYQQIPWGIVTNKQARFVHDILQATKLDQRAACVICGDSLSKRKPDPDQILHALALLKRKAKTCLYVGDTEIDVIASKAAGTRCLVALYGYIGEEEKPEDWQADGYIQKPIEIIDWLCEKKTA